MKAAINIKGGNVPKNAISAAEALAKAIGENAVAARELARSMSRGGVVENVHISDCRFKDGGGEDK